MAVLSDGATLVTFLVAIQELACEVVNQLGDLLLLPFVFALVIVNRVLAASEQFSNGAALAVDLAGRTILRGHWVTSLLPVTPASISRISRSRAWMSASISSRGRGGRYW